MTRVIRDLLCSYLNCPTPDCDHTICKQRLSVISGKFRDANEKLAVCETSLSTEVDRVMALSTTNINLRVQLEDSIIFNELDWDQQLSSILEDTEPNAYNWRVANRTVTNHFKVPNLVSAPINVVYFRTWFNTQVYPHLLENNGRFKLVDDLGELYGLTSIDFVKVIRRSYADILPFVVSVRDCEDFVMRVRTDLTDHYEANNFFMVFTRLLDVPNSYHAIGVHYGSDDIVTVLEPQNDLMWELYPGNPPDIMPALYLPTNWDFFI